MNTPASKNPARFVYPACGVLLLILTFLGFQQFYLHGQAYPTHPIAPPLMALVIAHGVSMTCWILLFVTQTFLIAGGKVRAHMALGTLGVVLAAVIVIVGVQVPIQAARVEPDVVIWGLHRIQFMAIPLIIMAMFTGFVTVGIWQRRKPQVHRPMMLMATLSVLAAATDRITGLPGIYATTIFGRLFGPFFIALLIGAVVLVLRGAINRKLEKPFVIGFAVLVAGCMFIMQIAPTRTWEQFATFLVR